MSSSLGIIASSSRRPLFHSHHQIGYECVRSNIHRVSMPFNSAHLMRKFSWIVHHHTRNQHFPLHSISAGDNKGYGISDSQNTSVKREGSMEGENSQRGGSLSTSKNQSECLVGSASVIHSLFHALQSHISSASRMIFPLTLTHQLSRILEQLKRYGVAGILSYGLLNTAYYLTAFLVVWFYLAPVPGKMGYLAAVARFLKVMAMVWAGSQVTKLIRAAGIFLQCPCSCAISR